MQALHRSMADDWHCHLTPVPVGRPGLMPMACFVDLDFWEHVFAYGPKTGPAVLRFFFAFGGMRGGGVGSGR